MQKRFEIIPEVARLQAPNFAWQPKPHGDSAFAFVWYGSTEVGLYDSSGQRYARLYLETNSSVTSLSWDRDGECLAVSQTGGADVTLWDAQTQTASVLDTGGREVTFMEWSAVGHTLAVGTSKGLVILYDRDTKKRETVLGPHTRAIRAGSWGAGSVVAVGSEDKLVSLLTSDGALVQAFQTPMQPSLIRCARAPSGTAEPHSSTFSVLVGDQSVFVYSSGNSSNPLEICLNRGFVSDMTWVDDAALILGYSTGDVVVLKVDVRQNTVETVVSHRIFAQFLDGIAFAPSTRQAALAGDGVIRLMSADSWEEVNEGVQLHPQTGRISQIAWSHNGELLSFCTNTGYTGCYSARRLSLAASFQTKILHATSLSGFSLTDARDQGCSVPPLTVDFEPTIAGCGPRHCALGRGNSVKYFRFDFCNGTCEPAMSYQLDSRIAIVAIGHSKAAILAGGRVYVHSLEAGESSLECLPNRDNQASATACAIADDFLVVAHSGSYLTYFSLTEKTGLCEYRHAVAITSLYPNPSCTKTVFQDAEGGIFLHSPCTETCMRVAKTETPLAAVLWDMGERTIFICCTETRATTYCYMPFYIAGEAVREVKSLDRSLRFDAQRASSLTEFPEGGGQPLTLLNGILTYKLPSGKLATLCLKTHTSIVLEHKGLSPEKALPKLLQLVSLNKISESFEVARDCVGLQPSAASSLHRQIWELLGKAALDNLDLDGAEKAYQRIPRPDMLLWLKDIRQQSDEKLVAAGNIYIHTEEFDKAEEAFLKSTQPTLALDLLMDLQTWDRALTLAQQLDPSRLGMLHLRYAQALEDEGKFQQALRHYERAREKLDSHQAGWKPRDCDHHQSNSSGDSPEERENAANKRQKPTAPEARPDACVCLAGMARCAIRIGEIQRGMQMAVDLGDPRVLEEGAALLEKLKQLPEAARLHEKAGNIQKAATMYIETHEFDKAAQLMKHLDSPRLQLLWAQAKEAQGFFAEAVAAYAKAKNNQAVVRIMLYHLHQEQEAFNWVRQTRSSSAAETAAEFCRKRGLVREAVEFLVAAGRVDEALELAKERDEMESLVHSGGSGLGPDVQKSIALYYEKQHLLVEAARHYANSGLAEKALDLYLRADQPAYDAAIDLVGRTRDARLIRVLQERLEGISDGIPKDPVFIHRFHVALGNHAEAANCACRVARKEQEDGQYKAAHEVLFRAWKDLEKQQLEVPEQLFSHFATLHSYILVRRLMRDGDFTTAAFLLERVLENIQGFETHAASILTSAILVFQRASMKRRAHKYSCQLLIWHEWRQKIPEKHRRTVETCARKPPLSVEADPEPATSPCPFCSSPLPDFTLACSACVATALQDLLTTEEICPMCEMALAPGDIVLVEASSFLRRAAHTEPHAEEGAAADVVKNTTEARTSGDGQSEKLAFINAAMDLVAVTVTNAGIPVEDSDQHEKTLE
ncbi:hypothetical protein BESB_016510 [Besnoitia besnoiti]|uniref:Uncharacterized protein n=1 Tax=Besnoitia besnoiti TaxID=94643 RepID=A0A2A9M9J0_BESBE|nr:hypothetical protein BESB_016510 [Besnoitia besnoiti]PFH32333.1 hypothetical protein BESB_016510 [Besnoitia besnoiti]